MGYVFRLEKGCFGEEEGGHSLAMGHWGTVLECGFENTKNQGWHGRAREHGVVVPNGWLRTLWFAWFLSICVVFVFLFEKCGWAASLVKWQPWLLYQVMYMTVQSDQAQRIGV